MTSLNPQSDHFNFDLWAREVREQMQTALQKRLSSSQEKTCEITASPVADFTSATRRTK